jgi:hypothetical protein
MFGDISQNPITQMMTGNAMVLNRGNKTNSYFFFTGNSMSLQARLDSLTSQDISKIVDAHITVTGV